MAESQAAPYVFVSYASADRERVLDVVASLRGAGMTCWLDQHDIAGGSNWGGSIAEAIEGCSALILMSSAASLTSRNVRQEIALAWQQDKPCLPLRLDATPVPNDIAYWLATAQWIEILDHPVETWLPTVTNALAHLTTWDAAPSTPVADVSAETAPIPSLPSPPSSFVGREREVAEIAALLHSERIVTLVGPGGSGKTRLAIAVGQRVASQFADGAVWVDLSPLRDVSLVMPTIAAALDVPQSGTEPVGTTVARAIGSRHLLLLADNWEQVIEAASEIGALLRACARLHVLATSRAALHISGEREFVVEPMPLPDDRQGAETDLASLSANPAVRLFVARAEAVKAGFALTTENARAVVEICQRVDGLPLAVELAAARVKVLSPSAILQRLERPLMILTGGARDLPARQHTIRTTIQWSCDLLSPDEQRLLERLSVFVGGWTLDAADAVVMGANDLDIDLLDGLAALADNTLVRVRDEADGSTRFTMLETIREFGLERLNVAGDADETRRRHADYYCKVVSEAGPLFDAGASSAFLHRLLSDRDNLRAMLAWGLAHNPSLTLAAAAALPRYWLTTGQSREGFHWLERALDRTADAPPDLRAKALTYAGSMAGWLGEVEASIDYVEQGLALYRQVGDQQDVATALIILARNHSFANHLTQARALSEQCLSLFRALGDVNGIEMATGNLGVILGLLGDYSQARHMLQDALSMARSLGSGSTIVWLTELGQDEALYGDPTRASAYLRESLQRNRDLRDARFAALCLEALAYLGLDGNSTHPARLLGAAAGLRAKSGYPILGNERQEYDRIVTRVRDRLGTEQYDEAWQDGYGMTLEDAIDLAIGMPAG